MSSETSTAAVLDTPVRRQVGRSRTTRLLIATVRSTLGKVGLTLVLIVVAIALIGPYVTPDDPTAIVGAPFAHSSGISPLGTDYLGRDVLSRFLDGGRLILMLSFLSTIFGVGVGTLLGLIAGYRRGLTGQLIMRSLDIILCFPPILLTLLFMSVLGVKPWLVLITVGSTHVPPVARVVESATLALSGRGFVEYAEMIGMSRRRLILRELLANMTAPLMVQLGIRMAYSIGFIGALAYLGFGTRPPAADWGSMIEENQINLVATPLPVLVPILALGLLTIGVNLLTDAFGRAAGLNLGKEAS